MKHLMIYSLVHNYGFFLFPFACSQWVMMNKETRRLSKIPDEARAEIEGYFVDSPPVIDEDSRKLPKLDETTADYTRSGLTVSCSIQQW